MQHKGLSVITGKESNITAYDFDDYEEYKKLLLVCPELINCKTIRTRKGVHLYFKYNPSINTTTNAMISYNNVDIRNDKGMLYAPPTKYYFTRWRIN